MSSRRPVALVGIGNSLAGDDGVGPEMLKLVQARWGQDDRLLFLQLESDLFALSDHLQRADHFIFLDAVAGETVGAIQMETAYRRGFAASLHQTDLGAVMASLEALDLVKPFPTWEVWGVSIQPPQEFKVGLSPEVAEAAQRVAMALDERLAVRLDETDVKVLG